MPKLIFTFYLLIILSFQFCSNSGIKDSEKYEGIKNKKLRVYIRNDYADTIGEKEYEKKLMQMLLKSGKDRAIHLIISYIRANILDSNKYHIFDKEILKSVENGKIKFRECNDEYCEIYIDYKINGLLDNIKKNMNSLKE